MEETVIDPHVHHSTESENDSLRKLIFWILAVLGAFTCFSFYLVTSIIDGIKLFLGSLFPGQPLPGLTQFVLETRPFHFPLVVVFVVGLIGMLFALKRNFWQSVRPAILGIILVVALTGTMILFLVSPLATATWAMGSQ